MVRYNTERLKLELAYSIQSFCLFLFPNGKCKGGEFCVGSLRGEPGNSLKICMQGKKTGIWRDFATGECGNNLLDLLYQTRGYEFYKACEEASNWLSSPDRFRLPVHSFANTRKHLKLTPKSPKLKIYNSYNLQRGTVDDYKALSKLLNVSIKGIELAVSDGILWFFDSDVNGRCWTVTDKHGYVRQDRTLSGEKIILRNKDLTKSRTIGTPTWPIGIPTEKKAIMLVEGSSDLLAAYSLICAENLEEEISPISMLGASNTINSEALHYFSGKRILGFPDYDFAGITGMSRWAKQLQNIVDEFKIFDYLNLIRNDGEIVKDLRDFISIDVHRLKSNHEIHNPLSIFLELKPKTH